MEAPEKIYIHPDIGGREFLRPWLRRAANNESIEYTRTDVFIEKVEKAIIEWAGTYISKTTGGGVGERKVLAADLLNYFRNYMKGE